jgi:extracellular elastinolytic metalloproteinase
MLVAVDGSASVSASRRSALPSDAAAAATAFLEERASEHGLTAADVRDLRTSSVVPDTGTGLTHVYLQQQVEGIDVAEAIVNVAVDSDGQVVRVASTAVKGAAGRVNADGPELTDVQAARRASAALDLTPDGTFRSTDRPSGLDRTRELGDGGVSTDPIPANLVYQLSDKGALRLAWELVISPEDGENWWQVRIDAATGRELERDDWVQHDSESYEVYATPVEAPTFGERTVLTDPADQVASPYGWLDTNGEVGADTTLTDGNNVHAYTDIDNNNSPDPAPNGEADGGPSHAFNFPVDFAPEPDAYRPAAVTNLFYMNNRLHDVLYRYGFTEAAGNFQVDNYGKGGAGGDAVNAEAQDGGGLNNANFGTPPDGQAPRMQMYLWNQPVPPRRDGDFDNGMIAHEYGHGVTDRLTGGPAQAGCLGNDEPPSEGWSDFFAYMFTMRNGTEPAGGLGLGTYLLGQSPSGPGIRHQRYSTDPAVNTTTYDSIKTAFSNGLPDAHDVGEVWAEMLWEMTWALIDEHGYDPDLITGDAGNNLAMQLVMDGLKLQPCSPGFVDARDAIIAADELTNDGANECLLWGAFAKRGLGYSASQGQSSSITDGTEAIDISPQCQGLSSTTTAPTDVRAGAIVTYDVALDNGSDHLVSNAVAKVELDATTTYVAGSATCAATSAPGTNTVDLTVPSLAAGTTRHCTLQARTDQSSWSKYTFTDGFGSGLGAWALTHPEGDQDWSVATGDDVARGQVALGTEPAVASVKYLTSAQPIKVAAGARLDFDHRVSLEAENESTAYDGGQILLSDDGGSTWSNLETSFLQGGYSHTMFSGEGETAFAGEPVFSGTLRWQHSVVDLAGYEGQDVLLRFAVVTDVGTDGPGWRIDDLTIGSPVDVSAVVVSSADGVIPETQTVTTEIVAPAAPGTVSAVSAARTSRTAASVSFTPGDDGGPAISGYSVECVAPGGATATAAGTASPVTVTGLTPGGTYTCRARAANSVGAGPWSAPSAAHLQAVVPGAASVTSARAVSPTAATVAVAASDDGGAAISEYAVECASTGGATGTASGASSPVTVTGLAAGRTYTCRVRASTAAGTGPWSAASAAYLQAVSPAAPRVRKVKVTGRTAAVTLKAGATGGSAIKKYAVTCTSTNRGKAGKATGAKPKLTVAKLTAGKTYRCRATATTAAGTSGAGPRSKPFKVKVVRKRR